MDWKDLTAEELEWVEVHVSGPHHDFNCTRRIECEISEGKYATHYVRFGIEGQEKEDWQKANFFYACKDCIRDSYWEVNETDVIKEREQ